MWDDDVRLMRAYPEQPPVIPHRVDGYQIDKNFNKCLDCHARAKTDFSLAVPVSSTHYMNREGKVLAVRTYSAGENLETVPQRAGKYGLKVWHGAWLNDNDKENLEQINLLIDHANRCDHRVKREHNIQQ